MKEDIWFIYPKEEEKTKIYYKRKMRISYQYNIRNKKNKQIIKFKQVKIYNKMRIKTNNL